MTTLHLVTAANASYLPRITPYLHSVQRYAPRFLADGVGFDRCALVTVGCKVEMPDDLYAIDAVALPAHEAWGHTGNWCIQQGCFLERLGAADDDVIVFTDGDITMQRAPSADEIAWMRAIPQGTFAAAWNAGPGDSMANEADRLSMRSPGREAFADVMARPIYNVGVFVARAATYRAIYGAYLGLWEALRANTDHYAANQFGMCAAAWRLGLHVWEMSAEMHTHGCWGVPPWASMDADGLLTVGGVPVLFKHHF